MNSLLSLSILLSGLQGDPDAGPCDLGLRDSSETGMARAAWPDYRGPTGEGQAGEQGVPREWSETKNVRWKTPIHGRGWSTPVIVGRRIWLTTATEDGTEMSALAMDRETGAILFDRVLIRNESPSPLGNDLNCYASPSPVADGDRVWVHFGSYGTACLDATTGELLWERRDLPCDHFRGPASSPVLVGDLIVLHMDGADHQYIVALHKDTGATAWRTPRSTDYRDLDENGKPARDGDMRKAYNTPLVVERDGRTVLVSPAAKAVYGYEARTGRELWQVRYDEHSTASRTVVHGDLAIVNTGYARAQIWAVRLGGEGDVTESHVVWKRTKTTPNRASPVLVDGRLYTVTDKGVVACVDAATGEERWAGRLEGNFSSSMVVVDGLVWCFGMEGEASAFRPGDTFEVVAANRLEDGFMACPVAVDGAWYLRTRSALYRIQEPEKAEAER